MLITGSSRGIGAACARLFAQNGWAVALHYNQSLDAALALKTELISLGCDCDIFCADIAKREQIFDMVQQVISRFGRLDALVANAGISQQKLFTDITQTDWENMLAVNLSGTFYSVQAVLPHMLSRKSGKIVTISSIWGICGASCEVHYSAVKSGIIGLTKALAQEVAQSGINVNCVAPGITDTDMCLGFSQEEMLELRCQTPLQKIGAPNDIAQSVCFLCSDGAGFITGQVLSPNGGLVI